MQRGAALVYVCRAEGSIMQAMNGPSCHSELEEGDVGKALCE